MRDMLKTPASRRLCAILAAAGFAMAGAPVLAQTVEEVTVVGRIGPEGEPQTLSRTVSYRDLDITTDAGQTELKRRINDTARDLCRQLGETGGSTGVVPSCEDAAVKDATAQMRRHVAAAQPRGPSWTPAPLAAAAPPEPEPAAAAAPAAPAYAAQASVSTQTITNGPVPDTAENRRKYGGPMSRAGQRTGARGN